MPQHHNTFIQQLHDLRTELNLSQLGMAAYFDIDEAGAYQAFEKGRRSPRRPRLVEALRRLHAQFPLIVTEDVVESLLKAHKSARPMNAAEIVEIFGSQSLNDANKAAGQNISRDGTDTAGIAGGVHPTGSWLATVFSGAFVIALVIQYFGSSLIDPRHSSYWANRTGLGDLRHAKNRAYWIVGTFMTLVPSLFVAVLKVREYPQLKKKGFRVAWPLFVGALLGEGSYRVLHSNVVKLAQLDDLSLLTLSSLCISTGIVSAHGLDKQTIVLHTARTPKR